MTRSRTIAVPAALAVLSIALTACAPSPDDVRREALEAYVDAERDTIPALHSSLPGMYSSLEISGEVAAEADSAAVIYFTYTYARTVEFGDDSAPRPSWKPARPSWLDPLVPYSVLEAGQTQLKQACDTQLFPAIRKAGVTGPVRIFYTFLQPSEEVSWDVSCTSAG